MSPIVLGIIGLAAVIVLAALRMQIGFALATVGFLGLAYLRSLEVAIAVVRSQIFYTVYHYGFTVIPLFVLLGAVAASSGIGERFYLAADKWLGQVRGGLALATMGTCAGFAAVCGSSVAETATMCKLAFPEMERHKYKPELSAGCIATGGTLGILIPPSLPLILYAVITEESIGKLFMAGIIPGIIHASLYMLVILAWVRLVPSIAPSPKRGVPIREKLASLSGTGEIVALFVLVMGGIFFGFFTPTEAGGIGAAGAILITLARRMLNRQKFLTALVDTTRIAAMISLLLVGALIFKRFLAMSRLPFELVDTVAGFSLSPISLMWIILLSFLLLGTIMDTPSMLVIMVPIYFPLVTGLGFDPIWFGIIVVVICEIGMITPPVGMNVWIIAGMLPHVPMEKIFKGVLIFLTADLAIMSLLVIFPQLALFLPSIMG